MVTLDVYLVPYRFRNNDKNIENGLFDAPLRENPLEFLDKTCPTKNEE